MLDEQQPLLSKQEEVARTPNAESTASVSDKYRETAEEDESLRVFLCNQTSALQLLDLLQLAEFIPFATYACCGERRVLIDLLLRQMDKLHVTKDQLQKHFAAFEKGETITMLRWTREMYAFPSLSLIDGTSTKWKELALNTTTPERVC